MGGDRRRPALIRIFATIFVERESQKKIVIGKGGSIIKAIGIEAREELESILGAKIYLQTHVRFTSTGARTSDSSASSSGRSAAIRRSSASRFRSTQRSIRPAVEGRNGGLRMMNYIWFALMAIAFAVAAINGTADGMTRGAIDAAGTAVQVSIGLVGVMALWLGIMRVAEKAGLVNVSVEAIAPILRWLFPDIPKDHPAIGAIAMSLAANALGLNNAATPLGIKAMEELQTAQRRPRTASNAMVTFLAMLTSGVQLLPGDGDCSSRTAGSVAPTVIIGTTLVATAVGTTAGVVSGRALQRFFPEVAATAPNEVGEEREQ